MKRVGLAEARNHLSLLVNDAAHGGERILIQSRGRPKAAIVGLEDLERLQRVEQGPEERPNEMLRWLEQTERLLRRQSRIAPSTANALQEVREEKVAESADLYRRKRRPKAGRKRGG